MEHQARHRCQVEADIDLGPVLVLLRLQQLLQLASGQLGLHVDAFSEQQEQIDEQEARAVDEAVDHEALYHDSLEREVAVASSNSRSTVEPEIVDPVVVFDLGQDHLHD